MRVYSAVLILVVATVSACGSGSGGRRAEKPSSTPPASAAASRIQRCVERLLRHATSRSAAAGAATRRYARETYCAPFENSGWIYHDGALSIAAQNWLDHGATCATAREGEPARTVPCTLERGSGGIRTLDCALLRIVRRSEARAYIAHLETSGPVACDDGTALDALGIP